MHTMASTPAGRAVLHGAAFALRPFRFALGISQRVLRPLHVLLSL